MNINFIKTDKFKTKFISIAFAQELRSDSNTVNALIPDILKTSCGRYDGQRGLNIALQNEYGASLAASVRKKGAYQIMSFTSSFLKNKYAINNEDVETAVLNILKAVIMEPKIKNGGFDEEIVEIEKKNLRERIESKINDKTTYGIEKCTEIMWGDSPYALSEMGKLEDIDKIDGKMLYSAYQKMLEDSEITITVIGDNHDRAVSLFSDLQGGRVKKGASNLECSEKGEITEKIDINQCKLTMTFTTGVTGDDADYFPMLLASSVWGGGPTSKLFMNVREKLSLCYYAAARYSKANGQITVYSGVENKNLGVAKAEIINQLNDLKNGVVTDEEFLATKISIINSLRSYNDSQYAMEDFAVGESFFKVPITVEEAVVKVNAVTKEDAIKAAQKIKANTVFVLSGGEDIEDD